MKHVWSFAGISPKHSVHCLGGLMSEKRVTPAAVNAQCPRLGSVTLALRSASERENVTVEVGGCFLLQLLVAKTSTKTQLPWLFDPEDSMFVWCFSIIFQLNSIWSCKDPQLPKNPSQKICHTKKKPKLLRRSKEIRQVEGEIRSKAQGSLVAFLMVQHVPQCLGVVKKVCPPKFDEGRYPQKRMVGWKMYRNGFKDGIVFGGIYVQFRRGVTNLWANEFWVLERGCKT